MSERKMRTGFAMVPDWVIRRVTDGTAMRVYLHLACKYADADRKAFPEMETLAEELEISERTVRRAVAALLLAGAIEVDRSRQPDGYFGRNLYTLPLDDHGDQVPNMAAGSDQEELSNQRTDLASGVTDLAPGPDQGKRCAPAGQDQRPDMTGPGQAKYDRSKNQPDPKKQPDFSSSEAADAATDQEPRADVDELCALLHDWVVENGSKEPTVGKGWKTAARLLLDRDKRPLDEAREVLAWSQADEFWRANIRSMPKFRAQYDALRLRWQQANPVRYLRSDDAVKNWLRELWREGRVKAIEERSGLRYCPPELPEGINSVDKAREFHLNAARAWIKDHHDEITKLIQQREQPVAS